MKRHILAIILAMLFTLAVVGTASALGPPGPPPTPPLSQIQQGQGNSNQQGQIQIVPIAPQLNLQNVNVGTHGDVEQGNANNANTGQANQQQNTQVAVQSGAPDIHEQCSCEHPPPPPGNDPEQHQGNSSSQGQVQVLPIAPQANVQNVNILTKDDVEQGDANNANTGQASQQENTQVAAQNGGGEGGPAVGPDGGQSQTIEQGQGNHSSQGQVQVIPIAPQANVQNVNVLTSGDVSQGDANNANTGQANQQENTQVAVQGSGGPGKGGCCATSETPSDGSGQSVNQHQGNSSTQQQIQIVPIAPQLNVQNVNVGTGGNVHQGDANNANTGQANQQKNTQVAVQKAGGPKDEGCGRCMAPWLPGPPPSGSGDQSVSQHQGNWSSQKQIQVIPIAPQANLQNVNVLTFGGVDQGNANNANTGQANQQQGTQIAVQKAGRTTGRPGYPGGDGCEPGSKPAPGQSVYQHQGNWNKQKQLQFIPIAPQANLQNVNVLTWGSIWQGNANNANTGQANQQQETQIAAQGPLHQMGGPLLV